MSDTEKPPLGLRPARCALIEFSWIRVNEIIAAMKRYAEAQKPIPGEWIEELSMLILELNQSKDDEQDNATDR